MYDANTQFRHGKGSGFEAGTNLNGYSNKEMAEMFSMSNIPDNIVFEEEFYKLMTIV